jgi:predicted DNA-binding protein YlxM (UPF0122 family)
MDKVYEIAMLLDFYGQLLTERQFEILNMYYNNDYSLGEIAQCLSISRQGVHDSVKKGKVFLNNMEEKLGLVRKFTVQKDRAGKILEYIRNIEIDNLSQKDIESLKKVEIGIIEIIES